MKVTSVLKVLKGLDAEELERHLSKSLIIYRANNKDYVEVEGLDLLLTIIIGDFGLDSLDFIRDVYRLCLEEESEDEENKEKDDDDDILKHLVTTKDEGVYIYDSSTNKKIDIDDLKDLDRKINNRLFDI